MFKKYVLPKKGIMIYTLFVKMLSTLFGISIPAILSYIIDEIVPSGDKTMIILIGIGMLLCAVLEWVLGIYSNRVAAKVSAQTIKDIRQDLFERSISLSQKQIDKFGISSIESRLTSDTYSVHNFLGTALRMGARSVMLFVGGVIYCIILSPQLSLIILMFAIPLSLSIRYIHKKANPKWKELRSKVDKMVLNIRESIRGIKVAKALNKVSYEKEKFNKSNLDAKNTQINAAKISALTSPFATILLYGNLFIVIYIGIQMINSGEIKVGTIIAFIFYFMQLTQSIFMMDWMINIYNQAMTAMSRIDEILFLEKDSNQIVENQIELPNSNKSIPEIEFRNVNFKYDNSKAGLKNISFRIMPGENLGLMGKTGSGKSTIIKLLLRQYDVDSGEILLRGVNIKNLDQKVIKKLFGIVFQNDFIYQGSIRENISFGRNLSDDILLNAAENAQAYEFIQNKENSFDHDLQSKGVNLSGGQKQRILLSRALANNPEILILDDSSSALDYKTDAKLREALNSNYKDSTNIIIAQRISSVINCNQIIFLENGRIKDIGNHEYMLENSKEYKEIADMQLGKEEGGNHE